MDKIWTTLYKEAKKRILVKNVPPFIEYGNHVCAILSGNDNIYHGVSVTSSTAINSNAEKNAILMMFNEGETTAKTYETLAKYCNENGIKTIFSENSETSKEAETLANEIKGKVERIYSLESSVKGKGYIEAMKINLEKIYKALIS